LNTVTLTSWLDYTVNGLVVGNIYALLAVGLALIFGVANLINFAHGSVFSVGGYVGWTCAVYLHLPLPATVLVVILVCALLGMAIERFGTRPLQGASRIAPLLATIGIGLILDQLLQLVFSPDPRALPSGLPPWRFTVFSGATIGTLDLLIAGVGTVTALVLWAFLRFSRLGWAVRATAQDTEAARQMGIYTDRVNMLVFAIASALGGVGGLLIGMYYNNIDPSLSLQATLKGIVAAMVGGIGSLPGAIIGGLLLGLTESYGIGIFGASYRDLFAFLILILVLLLRPGGLFARNQRKPEPLTGTFVAWSRPVRLPRWLVACIAVAALVLPLTNQPYLTQIGTNALLYGLAAMSLTLIAGTTGQVSLGQAALLAIGGYASALLASSLGWPVVVTIPLGGVVAAALGTLLVYPAFRMQGHYVAIATLAIAEIVSLVILNWTGLTGGSMGLSGIPPLALGRIDLSDAHSTYYVCLVLVAAMAALQYRLLGSHLGRSLRAVRDDEIAARSFGLKPERYKTIAFLFGGFGAGLAGAVSAHQFSYIDSETFGPDLSILVLTMVILGGLGNIAGALLGSLLLVALPEAFRALADYRILIYGVALLLLIRVRPQGLLGTT
jgi:branched-chain amino acid transport system permease protein